MTWNGRVLLPSWGFCPEPRVEQGLQLVASPRGNGPKTQAAGEWPPALPHPHGTGLASSFLGNGVWGEGPRRPHSWVVTRQRAGQPKNRAGSGQRTSEPQGAACRPPASDSSPGGGWRCCGPVNRALSPGGCRLGRGPGFSYWRTGGGRGQRPRDPQTPGEAASCRPGARGQVLILGNRLGPNAGELP